MNRRSILALSFEESRELSKSSRVGFLRRLRDRFRRPPDLDLPRESRERVRERARR